MSSANAARFVVAGDQEQVQEVLEVQDQVNGIAHIICVDPRVLRIYDHSRRHAFRAFNGRSRSRNQRRSRQRSDQRPPWMPARQYLTGRRMVPEPSQHCTQRPRSSIQSGPERPDVVPCRPDRAAFRSGCRYRREPPVARPPVPSGVGPCKCRSPDLEG